MAFENIDVNQLKSALNSCKNSINNGISKNLVTGIMNSDYWYCDARNNLKGSLQKLNDLYDQLDNKLNYYLSISNQIEKYQELDAENRSLNSKYGELEKDLYRSEEYDRWYYNSDTQEWECETDTRMVLDTNVQRQMNDIKNQIQNNENNMISIKNTVNSSI